MTPVVSPKDPPEDPSEDGGDDEGPQDELPEAPKAAPTPEVDAFVRTLLDAEYLSEAERAELRVRHGVWVEADLSTPALR